MEKLNGAAKSPCETQFYSLTFQTYFSLILYYSLLALCSDGMVRQHFTNLAVFRTLADLSVKCASKKGGKLSNTIINLKVFVRFCLIPFKNTFWTVKSIQCLKQSHTALNRMCMNADLLELPLQRVNLRLQNGAVYHLQASAVYEGSWTWLQSCVKTPVLF